MGEGFIYPLSRLIVPTSCPLTLSGHVCVGDTGDISISQRQLAFHIPNRMALDADPLSHSPRPYTAEKSHRATILRAWSRKQLGHLRSLLALGILEAVTQYAWICFSGPVVRASPTPSWREKIDAAWGRIRYMCYQRFT